MQKYTYICWIHTDAMNNRRRQDKKKKQWQRQTQEDFFIIIFTSHFIARVRKGCSRFACERELETEHELSYFDPTVMTVTLCLSCSLGLLNRRPRAHSVGCWLRLLHLISIFSGPKTPSGFPRAPSVGCGFPYHISSPTVWDSTGNSNSTGSSNSTELYNRSTPTRSLKSYV